VTCLTKRRSGLFPGSARGEPILGPEVPTERRQKRARAPPEQKKKFKKKCRFSTLSPGHGRQKRARAPPEPIHACVSYEVEDTCMSYEEEDTYMAPPEPILFFPTVIDKWQKKSVFYGVYYVS